MDPNNTPQAHCSGLSWFSSPCTSLQYSFAMAHAGPSAIHAATPEGIIALRKFETSKTYEILNNQGQRIYFAEERNNCFLRHLCGFSRPFTMIIYDNVGRDVLALHKALKCSCCWSRCCLQKLKVEAPPGETIGYVYQYFHPFLPKFKIKNENKGEVMKIKGPWLVFSCLRDLNFNLLTLDEEMVIGKISKHFSGSVRGILTNGEKLEIQFPFDLDVKIKSLMLGATFLIILFVSLRDNIQRQGHPTSELLRHSLKGIKRDIDSVKYNKMSPGYFYRKVPR
ncbi:phospholipid scramblase 1-like isoform X2 [Aotus nancymaae]